MSQIREAFIDSSINNRLNEYGGGESGLTSQNPGAGTQRKFSDYYNREFKVIKELTNPDAQLPSNGTRVYYNLTELFTAAELSSTNSKVINVRDPGVPIGYPNNEAFNEGEFGVLRVDLTSFNVQGAITLNNYAKIYAPGGIRQDYGDSADIIAKDGGNAITVEAPASGYQSYNLVVNNYGELRGGGGAGAPGGKGGNGQYALNGVLTESIGTNGGAGGQGRGYQSTSPYFTTITGFAAAAATNNAGRGGIGGSGGDWAQSGQSGDPGSSGVLGGQLTLAGKTVSWSIGIGGQGTSGSQNAANGSDTSVTFWNAGYASATGGFGGNWQGIGGAKGDAIYVASSASPTIAHDFNYRYGDGRSASTHGGAGGSIGSLPSGYYYQSSPSDDQLLPGFGRFLGTILNSTLGGGQDPVYGIPSLNSASSYGKLYSYSNPPGPGGSPGRWGTGGSGGKSNGGPGGDGNLGGGGGGAGGDDNGLPNFGIYWKRTIPAGGRVVTSLLNWNLTDATRVSIRILRADGKWGDSYESGEGIDVEYSLNNGSTWTSMGYVDAVETYWWYMRSFRVPAAARSSGVRLRVRQKQFTSNLDQWACGPAFVHYGDGTVDYLWDPYNIPGTFYTISGNEGTDYDRATIQTYSANGFTAPNLQPRGGDGGDGFVLIGYIDSNGGVIGGYRFRTPLNGNFSGSETIPAGTVKMLCWVVGGGGGGAGTIANDSYAGGGGGVGGLIYLEWDASGDNLPINTTGGAGSTTFGLPGKAVAFQSGRKPTFTLNNSGVISGTYT